VEDVIITVGSPELQRTDKTKNQVNLFLYAVAPNGAWRNLAMPPPGKASDEQGLPMPINLSYLLTAYGKDDNDLAAHCLLGWAMRRLHDAPVLAPDLLKQTERVRVTMQPLSVEELSKLWMMFKMPYSPAAAFAADVVLIESTRMGHTALPVLSRGEGDAGFPALPQAVSPFPTVTALAVLGPPPAGGGARPRVEVPGRQPGVRLGQNLVLGGSNLRAPATAPVVTVGFRRPAESDAVELPPLSPAPTGVGPGEIAVELPEAAPNGPTWRAGVYTASAVYRTVAGGDVTLQSNEFPLALVPRIHAVAAPRTVTSPGAAGPRSLVGVTCAPPLVPAQLVTLLVGDRAIPAVPFTAATAAPDFDVTGVPPGTYFVRLRVDGVESLLVQDYTARRLAFDPLQRLEVT
jgi:hypothetical protein